VGDGSGERTTGAARRRGLRRVVVAVVVVVVLVRVVKVRVVVVNVDVVVVVMLNLESGGAERTLGVREEIRLKRSLVS
jgi:hypothetical protein